MKKMFTVALVGGDGAGKTTIARYFEKSHTLPVKYLYMGRNPLSSNIPLPTSYLVRFFKRYSYRKAVKKSSSSRSEVISYHDLHHRILKRGPIWIVVSLLNRLSEALYRQVISLSYQLRGYIVLYDRHYLFEAAPYVVNSLLKKQKPIKKFEYWFFSTLYPKPNLVLFLDAPAEVLYKHKGEGTLTYLERQSATILELGKKMPNFVRVNANQPLDKVIEAVVKHIDFHLSTQF